VTDPATDPTTSEAEATVSETPETTAPVETDTVAEDVVTDDLAADVTEDAETAASGESDEAPSIVPSATAPVAVDRPVQTVGRRKEAVVRVRLMPGTGVFTLNGRTMDNYFPNKVHQQLIKEPLVTLEKEGIYDVHASLIGGGVTGQAGALRLGIARALIELEPSDRPPLKKAGFLKRDPRVKERKKYGLKKARKAPQYSKR
jgi:small subunit ribosomal protein S9